MICKKCSQENQDNAIFCCHCGTRIEEEKQENCSRVCRACGEKLPENGNFCARCGTPCTTDIPRQNTNISATSAPSSGGSYKTGIAYFCGVLCMIISLCVRLGLQEVIKIRVSYDSKYYLGIDHDIRPLIFLIPGFFALVISLLIVSDKTAGKTKAIPFIINAVFLVISVLFIWYDIPHSIY
ncbi:MAG: zinc ribbon domain-containing protein [Clostridia bacterium]|nr:zinc ribbon domain-containing protein [Clostridia bacterium]